VVYGYGLAFGTLVASSSNSFCKSSMYSFFSFSAPLSCHMIKNVGIRRTGQLMYCINLSSFNQMERNEPQCADGMDLE